MKKRILFVALLAVLMFFSGTEMVNAEETVREETVEMAKGNGVFGFWHYGEGDSSIVITKYTGAEENVVIPSMIAGKKVTEIDRLAFSGNEWVLSVNVPDTVTSVGEYCFAKCENLTAIYGMKNVEYIGWYAFYNCKNLRSVSLGTALQIIEPYAFQYCEKLNGCVFPSTLTGLGERCFENTGLTSVNVGASVEMGKKAFSNCQNLVSASVHTSISGYAFAGNKNLTTVSIGANANIGYNAFEQCSSLKNVSIANGNTGISIGRGAFAGCSGLVKVSLPSSVRYLEDSSFAGCTSLNQIGLSNRLLKIGRGAFSGCSSLISVVVPNTVMQIEDRAFDSCNALSSILIPNSVTNMRDEICSNEVTIKCYAGSEAEKYASAKGNPIVLLKAVPSSSIKFSAGTIYMNVDDMRLLTYSITPANTTDAVIWASSNTGIAEVNGIGEVTAKGVGSVTIIAKTTSGRRATVNIAVSHKPKEISFLKSSVTIMAGESMTQKAVVKDDAGVRNDIKPSYSSSNPKAASVSASGTVLGIAPGVAVITAKTGKLSASYKVTVVSNQPKSITFSKKKKTLVAGHTLTQKASVMGSLGKITSIKPIYSSSNSKVAAVSPSGQIKGLKEGSVTIKAVIGKLKATYQVQVVMAKISKKGKTLKITTVPNARVKVRAKKSFLGKSSKTVKADKKGNAKIKFRKKLKGITVKVQIKISGYKKKTIKKKF